MSSSNPDIDSDADTTSTEQGATTDTPMSKYDRVRDRRKLTRGEIRMASTQDVDDATRAYYAIKREDGYVGHNVGNHGRSAKIRVLYVTCDGTRSCVRMHDAREVNGGSDEHAFDGAFNAVLAREPDAGFETATKSIARFAALASRLHGFESTYGGDAL